MKDDYGLCSLNAPIMEDAMFRNCISRNRLPKVTLLVVFAVVAAACESQAPPLSPTSVSDGLGSAQSLSNDRCVNVFAEGTALLGVVELPTGTAGFGAVWFATTLGGLNGEMASVVVNQTQSGEGGAIHLELEHAFRLPSGDYFTTRDRAVCAPAGANPATCRVNDVLTITEGTGVFANASGSLRNHGIIDFAGGTLEFSVRGRVCGDGL